MAGALGAGCAALIWSRPEEVRGLAIGASTAWAASSASTAALMASKTVSPKAFWWAFGGGLALRLGALAGLMVYSLDRPGLSQPALLLAYALGVLAFLLIEYRHIKLR